MEKGSVYTKIINKGEQEAGEIRQKGIEKANSLTEQILKEAEAQCEQMIIEADEKNQDIINTKLAEQKQFKKQKLLSNRKKIIHETFNGALEKLKEINDKELTSLVINSLKKITLKGNEKIIVNKNEKSRYQKLFSSKKNNELDLLSKLLSNNTINLVLSEKVGDFSGGYIVESEYFDVDNSYEAILDNMEKALETEVALKLFRKED